LNELALQKYPMENYWLATWLAHKVSSSSQRKGSEHPRVTRDAFFNLFFIHHAMHPLHHKSVRSARASRNNCCVASVCLRRLTQESAEAARALAWRRDELRGGDAAPPVVLPPPPTLWPPSGNASPRDLCALWRVVTVASVASADKATAAATFLLKRALDFKKVAGGDESQLRRAMGFFSILFPGNASAAGGGFAPDAVSDAVAGAGAAGAAKACEGLSVASSRLRRGRASGTTRTAGGVVDGPDRAVYPPQGAPVAGEASAGAPAGASDLVDALGSLAAVLARVDSSSGSDSSDNGSGSAPAPAENKKRASRAAKNAHWPWLSFSSIS